MTKNYNLNEIELKLKNKAYLTFHGDGLLDILMGWNLIGVGIFLYTHSILFSYIGLAPLFFFKGLKTRLTLPRLGHARFRTRRTPSMWIIGSIGGIFLLAAIISGFILKDSLGFTGPIALSIFGIALLMVLNSGFNRILAYAILVPLFFVVGLGLGFLSPPTIIAVGATLMVYGIWTLVKFIQTNPVLDEEGADV